ncbi:MAG: acetolactate synthase large subunit [Candidatus Solincola sediminis]|uniref:Acetolactate synthase large subunit n=1 Tax=Candidatus Solincola sediminis TaxID=1797199 RepID=A0A1F2WTG0_9ACTN|nr:MAG: acetolactate synthase large subunit [Candidatus Solincola sediminis]OFW60822.1 MAG: acetolactate synthase large subunit [Candidatus Solincola sediminis]
MTLMNGGELLVRSLLKEGTKWVFGIPGGQLTTFTDAIQRVGVPAGMEFIMTHHEAAAAHMADAVSRTSDQVGVCMGTVGPGAANLVSGIYVAYNDGIPLIAICPQIHSNRCYPFRGSMQQLDQLSLFKPITKWNAVVNRWDRIPELVERAYRVATSGRPGPVHLDFPVDILFESRDDSEINLLAPDRYRTEVQPAGDPQAIDRAVEMMFAAEKPHIHAGGGVMRAKAWDEVRELAEYLQIPVTTSISGRGVLPEDHPLLFTPKGMGGIMAESNADLVLNIGCTVSEMDFWGQPNMWGSPAEQKFIYVDIDPENIGLNREFDLGITGDAKNVLSGMLERVKKETGPISPRDFFADYREMDDAANLGYEELGTSEAKPIHPLRLAKEAVDFFGRDGIMVMDGGNICLWTNIVGRIYKPRSFLWPEGTGQLGTGLPFALGAKIANPERPVFIIHGDGAFMLNPQEIETAVRYKLPVVDIIANDSAWGMIKGAQHSAYGGRYCGSDFCDVRYDLMAESMGAKGIRVEDPKDIRPALEEAAKSDRITVIDALIDPEVNLEVPVLSEMINGLWLKDCAEPFCGE